MTVWTSVLLLLLAVDGVLTSVEAFEGATEEVDGEGDDGDGDGEVAVDEQV